MSLTALTTPATAKKISQKQSGAQWGGSCTEWCSAAIVGDNFAHLVHTDCKEMDKCHNYQGTFLNKYYFNKPKVNLLYLLSHFYLIKKWPKFSVYIHCIKKSLGYIGHA